MPGLYHENHGELLLGKVAELDRRVTLLRAASARRGVNAGRSRLAAFSIVAYSIARKDKEERAVVRLLVRSRVECERPECRIETGCRSTGGRRPRANPKKAARHLPHTRSHSRALT